VLDLVARLRGEATVIFSSHILGDVQEVCDTVGILRAGDLLFQGSINQLLVGSAVPTYRLRVRPPSEGAITALRNARWVRSVEIVSPEEVRISVESIEAAEQNLAVTLAKTDARVVSFGPEAASLEQVFLELTS
jgi:ABC-2 type transport system ATP-binding protein